MEFRIILQQLLKEYNFTQVELAKRANIKPSQISEWLKGKANPGYETLKKLAVAFDVSSDYLLGLSDDGIHFGGKVEKTPAGGNTVEERELLEDYHELSKEGKELVKVTIKTLLGSARSGKVKKA